MFLLDRFALCLTNASSLTEVFKSRLKWKADSKNVGHTCLPLKINCPSVVYMEESESAARRPALFVYTMKDSIRALKWTKSTVVKHCTDLQHSLLQMSISLRAASLYLHPFLIDVNPFGAFRNALRIDLYDGFLKLARRWSWLLWPHFWNGDDVHDIPWHHCLVLFEQVLF